MTASASFRIEPLSGDRDRSRFLSGSAALDRYFQKQVSQDTKRRIATCFVALSIDTNSVAGYCTLSASGVSLTDLSPEIAKKLPRYPVVPVVLLGRLAVDRNYQGRGLGSVLLGDALVRIARSELGVFAMVVDAKDEAAQRCYERFGFTRVPAETRQRLRLCLPIATALRATHSFK